MAASPARSAAFDVLLRIERDRSYADELLHSPALSTLSPRDHGLATELVMGVLRWRPVIDDAVAAASSQKLNRLDLEVLTALRLGAYQLLFLTRVPARAAIFESVELVKAARKRSAAPFANAVLRKVAKEGRTSALDAIGASANAASLAKNAAHPEWLVRKWAERYSLETTRQICLHDQAVPDTAIHLHDGQAEAELKQAGIQLAPGRILKAARRVVAGNITETQAFRQGRVTIHDEASQLVALLAGGGKVVLDCCAAPGSKTSLLAARNAAATVFATDIHPHRARLLQQLHRLPNVHVVAADARSLPFSAHFDRILADVPCSGTGTLGRNPEIKWRLQPADLADMQQRQVAILKAALALLAPGGRLVYSTCSLEAEENEDVVNSVLAEARDCRVVDGGEELQKLRAAGELVVEGSTLASGPYLRTLPGVHPCDGFFAAVVERTRPSG